MSYGPLWLRSKLSFAGVQRVLEGVSYCVHFL